MHAYIWLQFPCTMASNCTTHILGTSTIAKALCLSTLYNLYQILLLLAQLLDEGILQPHNYKSIYVYVHPASRLL